MNCEQHCEVIYETAALYALGSLPASEAGQFEKQLSAGCSLCKAAYEECAIVADYLAASGPAVAPPPSLKQRLMDRIGREREQQVPGMVLVREADAPWRPAPIPGVEVRPLMGRKTMLVRMQPGASLPPHPHEQVEQCYVIEGSVTDAAGITAYAGDFVCMPANITHDTIRTETGCVFLITYTN